MPDSTLVPTSVPPFTAIVLDGVGTVVFTQNTDGSYSISEGEHTEMLGSDVRNGTLYIGKGKTRGSFRIVNFKAMPDVRVSAPSLERLSISGAGKADISNLRTGHLEVAVDGAGSIRMGSVELDSCEVTIGGAGSVSANGTAREQSISIVGTGNFSGDQLVGQTVSVNIAGAGRAKVHATRELEAEIGGVGQISYVGDPSVRSRVTGLGRIKRA
jgi:hypothetical protein